MAENNESKKVMYCDMDKFADAICKDMRLSEDEANKFIQLLWEQSSIDVAVPQNEMLPCPFCGGKAEVVETYDEEYPYQGCCLDCFCQTVMTKSVDEAKEKWNRRIPNA